MKYSIEGINIGDQLTFNSTDQQSNFDLYWTVAKKKGDILMIELKTSELEMKSSININEAVRHIHRFFV